MGIIIVFVFGVANFALHKAVLHSGHPMLAYLPALFRSTGGRFSYVFEYLMLTGSMLLVAQGSEADIVGSTTAVAVRSNDWARAFAVLNEAGQPVMLAGRDVRVADADADQVRTVLAGAGVSADVVGVPATIEERMMVLARAPERA